MFGLLRPQRQPPYEIVGKNVVQRSPTVPLIGLPQEFPFTASTAHTPALAEERAWDDVDTVPGRLLCQCLPEKQLSQHWKPLCSRLLAQTVFSPGPGCCQVSPTIAITIVIRRRFCCCPNSWALDLNHDHYRYHYHLDDNSVRDPPLETLCSRRRCNPVFTYGTYQLCYRGTIISYQTRRSPTTPNPADHAVTSHGCSRRPLRCPNGTSSGGDTGPDQEARPAGRCEAAAPAN